ncbi:hypothetical protein TNIN_460861 [Trichonephila inaurata madagascariensis]|uniref:Uncharacterized protein n=1 Tax=Trichonephila inaurata madagascariensis TaxID=2747483 RepID=A0A8X6WQY6_9ARAC|nr:hypothetical protein TNIN_460861 [Trichonephila inaurata madagascariensis]
MALFCDPIFTAPLAENRSNSVLTPFRMIGSKSDAFTDMDREIEMHPSRFVFTDRNKSDPQTIPITFRTLCNSISMKETIVEILPSRVKSRVIAWAGSIRRIDLSDI